MLTQQLQIERQKINQSETQKAKELSEALSPLKASNELMMQSKDERIAQLSAHLEGIKSTQNVKNFRA